MLKQGPPGRRTTWPPSILRPVYSLTWCAASDLRWWFVRPAPAAADEIAASIAALALDLLAAAFLDLR
jgi:hypothetical protein